MSKSSQRNQQAQPFKEALQGHIHAIDSSLTARVRCLKEFVTFVGSRSPEVDKSVIENLHKALSTRQTVRLMDPIVATHLSWLLTQSTAGGNRHNLPLMTAPTRIYRDQPDQPFVLEVECGGCEVTTRVMNLKEYLTRSLSSSTAERQCSACSQKQISWERSQVDLNKLNELLSPKGVDEVLQQGAVQEAAESEQLRVDCLTAARRSAVIYLSSSDYQAGLYRAASDGEFGEGDLEKLVTGLRRGLLDPGSISLQAWRVANALAPCQGLLEQLEQLEQLG